MSLGTLNQENSVQMQRTNTVTTIQQQKAIQEEILQKIDQNKVFVDPALGKIVLVCKDVMVKWREDQEKQKNDMEEVSNIVESKLRQEKYNYEKKIAEMEKIKTDQLNELNKDYERRQMEEAEQKDDNTQ